jgi:hypothetical protein
MDQISVDLKSTFRWRADHTRKGDAASAGRLHHATPLLAMANDKGLRDIRKRELINLP